MSGYETQGTRFFWSTSTARSTAQEITGVTDWSGMGESPTVIDVTSLASTRREKQAGLPDSEDFSFNVLFSATATGQVAFRADAPARTKRKMTIKYSTVSANGQESQFKGYSGGMSQSGALDDKVMASCRVILAAGVTHTTYAT